MFFEYSYYRTGHQRLTLLRRSRGEVEALRRFAGSLSAMTAGELSGSPRFLYVERGKTVNNYPDFNIRSWAKEYRYRVVERGRMDDAELVELNRDETNK